MIEQAQRGRAWRSFRWLLLTVLLLATACHGLRGPQHRGQRNFADAPSQVQVVTTQIGGKNLFIPATIVLPPGAGRSLSLYNTTDAPHGFQIPDLGVEAVLPPGVEFVVELPKLEARAVHKVLCHLHPPHRGATLLVLH